MSVGHIRPGKGKSSNLSPLHFVHDRLPVRVVFATGSFEDLGREAGAWEMVRPLVVATPSAKRWADRAGEILEVVATVSAEHQHVPKDDVRAATETIHATRADGLIAIGGGSTIGLAKGITLDCDLPIIAVPTTYAGSEVTPIFGITSGGRKRTGRDRRVLPKAVVYDPLLTVTLPADVTATTGMNAIAHGVEAMYASGAPPIVSLVAHDSIARLASSLPAAVKTPEDVEVRADALYGAFLAGSVLASSEMGIHHRIAHVLGGTLGLAHGGVNAALLPHVVAFNYPAAPEAMERIAGALGAADAAAGLYDLAASLGAPTTLKDIGVQRDDIPRAAELVAEASGHNPRPAGAAEIQTILEAAYEGQRPHGAGRRESRT